MDRIFRYLVTPSDAKIAYTPADLAEYVRRPADRVEELLRRLAGGTRVVRAVATPGRPDEVRYEIYHDKLAPAVLRWRRQRGLRAAESRARARRRLTYGVLLPAALAFVAPIAAAWWLFKLRR